MQKSSESNLEYWNESLLKNALPTKRKHRYLVFDVDQGGLNNIRLVFEYVAVLAAMTGRTLVLPPPSSWYLINHGPMPEEHAGGTTTFADLFNISALSNAIDVLETAEFIQQADQHLAIPEKFQHSGFWNDSSISASQDWQSWLLDNSEIPNWNPYNTVICMPTVKAAQEGSHLTESYLDDRQMVEFTPRMNAASVLYFPSNTDYRSLGPVATMLTSNDHSLPMLSRRFIKHHIRYCDGIFELTARILEKLDMGIFDAIQIRRNDFQYTETKVSTDQVCQNTQPLFDQGLPIYVATDESDDDVLNELATGLNALDIYRWQDVENIINEPIPYAWIGPIEQLICAAARRFVGNDLSTFTSYINRLRGYRLASDQNIYFHSQKHEEIQPTLIEDFRGRDYLRENPLFWIEC